MEPSVDHSKFESIKQPFENAHAVTAACLSCHTERDKEVMMTSHWKWEREEELEGKGVVPLGRKTFLTIFALAFQEVKEPVPDVILVMVGPTNRSILMNPPISIVLFVMTIPAPIKKEKEWLVYPDRVSI